jgi:2-polyprenyl-3-methyl-5-hydroxy-6-metoxy-1,4-benzoquinol methylase
MLSQYYEAFHRARTKTGTVSVPERLAFIAREVGEGKDVVELGCRYGDVLAPLRDKNRVTGVDIDRVALKQCAAKYHIATLLANLNAPLPLDDGQFDVVILSEVLEHLPYPSITLGEAWRILRPGGKLVGSVPNGTKLRNRLRFLALGVADVESDASSLVFRGSATGDAHEALQQGADIRSCEPFPLDIACAVRQLSSVQRH